MSETQLDLRKLALDRSPTSREVKTPHRRRWLSRYALPVSILLGFFALLGAAAGRHFLPRQAVTVVPVIVKRGEVQNAGSQLFQAAGWIEPRPTSVRVAALAPGVVEELLVVEGQYVAKGEPIARLIAMDAEFAVQQAEVTLAIREGELLRVEAERAAAEIRLKNPVHRRVDLADAMSLQARARTELDKLPFLVESAAANALFRQNSLDGKNTAQSAIAGVVLEQAKRDHAVSVADLQELQIRGPNLKRELDALQAKVDALTEQLSLLVDEHRQAEEANAKFISATAVRDEARLGLKKSRLNLERMVIHSPIDGRILRLIAPPGARVMGLDEIAGQNSSTVAEMYDPGKMQVRADVRLEDVPMVIPGAPVEVETASSGRVIHGRVLQSTSVANIQKNTLEVKVELIDPPANVSPDMLVKATFLAPQLPDAESKLPGAESKLTETERIFVPNQLVRSENGESFTWVVDAGNYAVRRSMIVGGTGPDGLVEIVEGLKVTDKLIASGIEGLETGDAVEVRGEDQTLGVGR